MSLTLKEDNTSGSLYPCCLLYILCVIVMSDYTCTTFHLCTIAVCSDVTVMKMCNVSLKCNDTDVV